MLDGWGWIFFLREKEGGFSGKGVSEGKRGTHGGAVSMDVKIHHGCQKYIWIFTSMVNFHIHAWMCKKKNPSWIFSR